MKPVKTLLLITDDRKARLLENSGVGKGFEELATIDADELPEANVRYADKPGRQRAAPGAAQHAMDWPTGEEEQQRLNFARKVVKETEKVFVSGGYDRFVMAAAPKMLGILREEIGRPLKENLMFDLNKDITDVPVHELPKYFEKHAAF